MIGTEKQIKWAQDIKSGIINGFERSIEWNNIQHPLIVCYIERIKDEFMNDSAVYWINLRGSDRSIQWFIENLWTQAFNISEAISDEIAELVEDNKINEAMDVFWTSIKDLTPEEQLKIFTTFRSCPIDYEG